MRPKTTRVDDALTLDDLIRVTVASEIAKLYTRCRVCGQFYERARVSVASCRVCYNGVFVVCEDCGGYKRAARSVLGHVSYFASKPARKRWGEAHLGLMEQHRNRYHRRQTLARRLRSVP